MTFACLKSFPDECLLCSSTGFATMSFETVARSTETLRHGADLLDDIAARGVIKDEIPHDELALQNQIAASRLRSLCNAACLNVLL